MQFSTFRRHEIRKLLFQSSAESCPLPAFTLAALICAAQELIFHATLTCLQKEIRAACACGTGLGQYGAVGFSYNGEVATEESSASDSEDSEEDPEEAAPEDVDIDSLAANLGIDSFSVLLRRAEREEAEMAQGIFRKRK